MDHDALLFYHHVKCHVDPFGFGTVKMQAIFLTLHVVDLLPNPYTTA